MKTLQDKMVLSNGQHIPYIGLGVFQMSEQNYITQAVMQAIQTGYRLFDTAAVYNNEKKVGSAIKECHVARQELFISSKIWNGHQGYDETLFCLRTHTSQFAIRLFGSIFNTLAYFRQVFRYMACI
ncbi:putative aldo/keto reductase, associated with diketogulonate reductase [Listeria fleischmannii FSL S10-1203]|uniref:Putative aldo/keto reductase, associated with diketogulonate reductase n=1 Tax=Listeria fleischmannii FSL S10-1203 TaxID=1265822 RepID=W7DW94_9LIST|nr:putative aldo/keto reductase, associated with diketogulonate reductase [Listeria fleischmannii FSL S10-1203]